MNKGKMTRSETGRNKFENFKLRLIALWHFITRKDYHLLVYKYRGGETTSFESYNIDIPIFIFNLQLIHNLLTAHDILEKLDLIRGLSSENKLVQDKVEELMETIEEQYGDLTLPSK